MTAETIARKWHDQFLRTDAIEHPTAESAVQQAYRAAGIAPPERFIWAASPIEAVWAVLVLVGKTDGYNHAVLESVERRKAGKAKVAEATASVAQSLGIGEDQVEGYFGKPFYVAEGSSALGKALSDAGVESWIARAEAGDDYLAAHQQGPFKPLHDLEQLLHFEGYQMRGGEMRGSLYKQALTAAGDEHIAIVGGRSAHHRLYGSFAYEEVALDEALAEAGKLEPTELQRAMWAAYEASGLWWPCDQGVVFSERPIAAELAPDGPRMEWADGFTLGGKPAAKAAAAPPAPATAPSAKHTAVLDATLPRDHGKRIAFLRGQAAALPHLDRYLAGEHEAVWTDLVALGEKVRTDEHAADALAVAYETMHRVEQNVRTLAGRLRGIGYSFVDPSSGGGFFGLRKAKAHDPFVPPASDSAERIAELENAAGGPIPLSLRAFFDVVGAVNFIGQHDSLSPRDAEGAPDPLMVYGIEDAIDCVESGFGGDEDEERTMYVVAPDALHKANVSGGDPYMIALPATLADAELEEEPHGVHFVQYLRIAIGWGGFPGWEQAKSSLPPELEELRRDLIAF